MEFDIADSHLPIMEFSIIFFILLNEGFAISVILIGSQLLHPYLYTYVYFNQLHNFQFAYNALMKMAYSGMDRSRKKGLI